MQATLDQAGTAVPEARAGFWRRFAAALVDGIVLGIINAVLRIALGTAAGSGLGALVSLAYFTFFHGRTGQTPGDAALGIKVVDLRAGTTDPIGYARAALRWFVSIASTVVILMGFLWMLWDPEKQTWHDKAAGSVPVRTDDL